METMIAGLHGPFERSGRSDASGLRMAVERRLAVLLPNEPHMGDLGSALRYSLLAPAKRIRPLLTLLAAWETNPQSMAALDAGCALEMVHTASLILDDMPAMDDAPERRGQAATHVRYGEDVAMLSAISLLNQAYVTVAAMDGVSAEIRCGLVTILARAIGPQGLAGGQYADLRPSNRREISGIAHMTHLTTGVLFVAAVEMAAVIHGMNADATARLRRCATELGQAFQILDDLIDGSTCLASGRPEDDGKSTLLALLGEDATYRRLQAHMDGALRGLQPDGPLADFVRSIFAEVVRLPETV